MIFRVTFGQQYSYQLHPTYEAAHPDGWLEIVADSESQARAATQVLLKQHYSMLYDEREWKKEWEDKHFPAGCIERFDAATVLGTTVTTVPLKNI